MEIIEMFLKENCRETCCNLSSECALKRCLDLCKNFDLKEIYKAELESAKEALKSQAFLLEENSKLRVRNNIMLFENRKLKYENEHLNSEIVRIITEVTKQQSLGE